MESILTAEEIREVRGMYGLTQKSFAQLLGIGQASIVRYENGTRPSRANANLIRAARHPEFMRECLERDGDAIPQVQRDNAMRVTYALVSLDPEEGTESGEVSARNPVQPKRQPRFATKMDEVYHYTLQQEVLNEQAANLSCDIMVYMIENGVELNDEGHPVSILLAQLLELKRSIVDLDDDYELEQVRGHLKYMKDFIGRLKQAEEVA